MRKTVIDPATVHSEPRTKQEWLDLEEVAKVEVTSEDPSFPLESALVSGKGPGWRAAQRGKQIIRITFDKPTRLCRIRLEFSETEIARTQEFTLQLVWKRVQPLLPFTSAPVCCHVNRHRIRGAKGVNRSMRPNFSRGARRVG